MKINNLIKYADANDIEVDYFPLSSDTTALSIPGAIALNKSVLDTNPKTVVALAHELGHQATNSFYRLKSKYEMRTRAEERATRWAVDELISADELKQAFKEGCTEVWQLAEYFEVTEDFIRDAVRIHKLKGDL